MLPTTDRFKFVFSSPISHSVSWSVSWSVGPTLWPPQFLPWEAEFCHGGQVFVSVCEYMKIWINACSWKQLLGIWVNLEYCNIIQGQTSSTMQSVSSTSATGGNVEFFGSVISSHTIFSVPYGIKCLYLVWLCWFCLALAQHCPFSSDWFSHYFLVNMFNSEIVETWYSQRFAFGVDPNVNTILDVDMNLLTQVCVHPGLLLRGDFLSSVLLFLPRQLLSLWGEMGTFPKEYA